MSQLMQGSGGTTTAWVVPLADAARLVRPRPSAQDLGDVAGRSGEDRRRFLLRRTTLRTLVARWCGVPNDRVAIGYDANGAPQVRSPEGPFCSVSARGDLAAFALSDVPVGVDIEPLVSAPIAWAALSRRETEWLRSLAEADRPSAFLRIFTVKEAYLKACGTGLLRDPADLTVELSSGVIVDGIRTVRLAATAVHRFDVAGRPVLAACFAGADHAP